MPSAEAIAAVETYAAFLSRPPHLVAYDLELFCNLLTKWNRAQNLVSRETADALWCRHVIDSLQLVRWVASSDRTLVDVGSGGGFPALPLAIALKGTGRTHLFVESNAKKAAFLRAAVREFGLDAEVKTGRAEHVLGQRQVGVLTARAVAPLVQLLSFVKPLLGSGTRGLFHKGREYDQELQDAALAWRFDVVQHASDTDPEGVILEIRNVAARQ